MTDWGSIWVTKWDQTTPGWGPVGTQSVHGPILRDAQAATGPDRASVSTLQVLRPATIQVTEPAESLQPWLAPTAEFPCKQEEVP